MKKDLKITQEIFMIISAKQNFICRFASTLDEFIHLFTSEKNVYPEKMQL